MINKQPANQSAAALVKTTIIIHLALTAGQILFAVVTFLIPKKPATGHSNDMLIFIVPTLAVSCFAAGHLLFKKLLSNINSQSPLKAKLISYQSATIIRLALLEGPSLFAIVSFLITGNMVFIGIAGLIILYFIYLRPTRQKIEDDLNLGYDEKAELN
ncbi:hypothetical protein [Mucilaginibacter celer]|uniref:Uncharacterized protein n=1 Tax=Mucilaginibacter celer TaxID=2305508 RepID=A0A494VZJ5_9SPHI|nr:hypothetical protein [Mucilaginibacter celer]AYL96923.1 hypothetical protein HYN43_017130 [Mucilaginibacter celer]